MTAAAWPVFNYKYWGNTGVGKRVGRRDCCTGQACNVGYGQSLARFLNKEGIIYQFHLRKGETKITRIPSSQGNRLLPFLPATLFQLRASQTSFNLSQCSQSPVKLQLSPKDIGVVHNIVCTKMLYVTVCYVCCLYYKIPMRCHWCCCFRSIRNPSLFFLFGLFGLNLCIILDILRSLWVQEHTNVVSFCLF